MSGVFLPNAEFPKDCHECEFWEIAKNCPCGPMSLEEFRALPPTRHKDCPLVHVSGTVTAARVVKLERENEELRRIGYLDKAEIIRLRRHIDFLIGHDA